MKTIAFCLMKTIAYIGNLNTCGYLSPKIVLIPHPFFIMPAALLQSENYL